MFNNVYFKKDTLALFKKLRCIIIIIVANFLNTNDTFSAFKVRVRFKIC